MNDEPQPLKGVHLEGAQACRLGLPRQNCPYPPGSTEREAWLDGWNKAANGTS
jgi:ribosome modulation factor